MKNADRMPTASVPAAATSSKNVFVDKVMHTARKTANASKVIKERHALWAPIAMALRSFVFYHSANVIMDMDGTSKTNTAIRNLVTEKLAIPPSTVGLMTR